jgi:hypothetical protein
VRRSPRDRDQPTPPARGSRGQQCRRHPLRRIDGRILNHRLESGGVVESGAAFVGPTQDHVLALQGNRITVAPGRCLTGVRLSRTLAADLSQGDGDPPDPAVYGFEYVDGGAEWNAVFRAVARHLHGCAR